MNPPNDPNNPAPPPSGYPPPQAGYQQPVYPQAQPGAWPPPPAGQYDPNAGGGNTSGMMGPVPPEIAALKWNWGAALLNWIWCCNHKLVAWGIGILVLSFVPYINSVIGLAAFIYFGINGHRMAWQNRRFEGGLPEYFAVQDAWMKWGIGIQIVSLIIVIAAVALGGFATVLSGMHPVHTTSP